MTDEAPPKGKYIVAEHGGEHVVCWVADATPAWWSVVARFTNKDRAESYASVETDCYENAPETYSPQEIDEAPPPENLPADALPVLVYMATQPGMMAEGLRLKPVSAPKPQERIAAPTRPDTVRANIIELVKAGLGRQEIAAKLEKVKANVMPKADVAAEEGYDLEEVYGRRADEIQAEIDLGIQSKDEAAPPAPMFERAPEPGEAVAA